MIYHVFDLDGTVIDSRHRYRSLPCGNIDLQHWLDNCTREQTFKDTLMPRAHTMRRVFNQGFHTIVCTSRTISPIWLDFLDSHGLYADAILARPEGCMDSDADLKEYMLDEYFSGLGTCLDAERVVMFEDHLGVVERLSRRGVLCSIEGYSE